MGRSRFECDSGMLFCMGWCAVPWEPKLDPESLSPRFRPRGRRVGGDRMKGGREMGENTGGEERLQQ